MAPTHLPALLSTHTVDALLSGQTPPELTGLLSGLASGQVDVEVVRLTEGQARPIDLTCRPERHATLVACLRPALEGGGLRLLGAPDVHAGAPGDAWLWHHVREDGAPDPDAFWELLEVGSGEAVALVATWTGEPDVRVPTRGRPALYVVVDGDEGATRDQLARAAAARGVAHVELVAGTRRGPLPTGSLLYRTGTSHAACVLEQELCGAHVATAYAHPLGAHIVHDNQSLWLSRLGVPTPRTLHALPTDEDALRAGVEELGGFPLVLKVPGRSHGVGVLRLKDWEILLGVADLVWAERGSMASLMECIEPAVHWRVIVVGGAAAAAYVNPTREGDFRTHVDEEREEYFTAAAPAAALDAALDAVAALGLEMGGVDVLAREDGEVFVLEVNAPCYFGHPWDAARIDVAGALVAHLLEKSERMNHAGAPGAFT
jgi:hypothetical protein